MVVWVSNRWGKEGEEIIGRCKVVCWEAEERAETNGGTGGRRGEAEVDAPAWMLASCLIEGVEMDFQSVLVRPLCFRLRSGSGAASSGPSNELDELSKRLNEPGTAPVNEPSTCSSAAAPRHRRRDCHLALGRRTAPWSR